jgi:hypothetical protein
MRFHVLVRLGALLCFLLVFGPALAFAQPRRAPVRMTAPPAAQPVAAAKRVLVERFAGPQAARVRGGLLADLADHPDTITLVADSELRPAAQAVGLPRVRTEADYAAVAQQLDVAAFVDGRVQRRGRAWTLTVRVRNGADGRILGSATWSGATMNALGMIRRNGHARLAEHLDAASSPVPPPPPEPVETPWYQRAAPDPEPPPQEEEDDDAPEGDDRYTAFRIGVGGGSLRRSMVTEIVPLFGVGGSATEGAAEPRSYQSAGLGHGELAVDVEFHPGAFGKQPFPYLGVVFGYRASLGLRSTGCAARDASGVDCPEDVVVNSTQRELYLGLRGRCAFGGPARGGELSVDLGYDYFGFSLDLAALERLDPTAIIPPVGYSSLHLGAGFAYPIVPTYFVVGARLAYRFGLGVSAEQKQVWGTQTTSAPGFSLALELKSGMPYLLRGLYIAALVQYFAFSTTYEGDTACTREPCTAWSPTTAGAPWQPIRVPDPVSDTYLRLGLSLGYEFR